jgi:hypothetical protein
VCDTGTLLVCQQHGDDSLVLVGAQAVKSVVAMVPFMEKSEAGGPRCHNGRFFVVEKPGLSLAELGIEEGLEVLQEKSCIQISFNDFKFHWTNRWQADVANSHFNTTRG